MLHPTNYTRRHTFLSSYGNMLSSSLFPFVAARAKYTKNVRGDHMEGGTGIHLRQDQVFCLVESQMVIFNFEEAGDGN